MPKIIVSQFCKNRDQGACKVPLEGLLPEILRNFSQAKPGYREGVVLIPVDPKNFTGRIVTLEEGDVIMGRYEKRQEGEIPRKQCFSLSRIIPDPLCAVDVVLYSRETIAENNENSDQSADYEVIAILTKISKEEQPMPPETLMANHFKFDGNGGTDTKMTPEQFETALRDSYTFWRDKSLLPE